MNETHYIHDLKIEIMDINATDCPYRVTNLITGESFMCPVESSAWHNCETLLAATKSNQEYLLYSLNRPDHEAVKIEPVSEPQTLCLADFARLHLKLPNRRVPSSTNGTCMPSLLEYLNDSVVPESLSLDRWGDITGTLEPYPYKVSIHSGPGPMRDYWMASIQFSGGASLSFGTNKNFGWGDSGGQ